MFVSSVEHVGLLRQQRATADEILKQSKVANSSFINKQRSYLAFSYVMTLSGDFFFPIQAPKRHFQTRNQRSRGTSFAHALLKRRKQPNNIFYRKVFW